MIGNDLNSRSLEIFKHIVESYVETGEPVGSRTLSQRLGSLSSATIRNVMADLEALGLLRSPHTSAGRLPTEAGLRLFVHGLLEHGSLAERERLTLDNRCLAQGKSLPQVLEEATTLLSGLSKCAGLVMAPKCDTSLKHIEFVRLNHERAMVVLITETGVVENRIIELPPGILPSTLVEASNYLNSRIMGRTLEEARTIIDEELKTHRTEVDHKASQLITEGLAQWGQTGKSLIVRGQAQLLQDVTRLEEVERLRDLFELLEKEETVLTLLESAVSADGVQIFIGSENNLFNLSGCSVILAPYTGSSQKVVGAIGVIGPYRMNYSRIIPMVDYTAKLIGRMIG